MRAAGGVVWRAAGGAGVEVLLVHRPRYDDWTLPKGKAHDDEPDEACAVREVEEETGLRCELRFELPATSYRDAKGRRKRVRYWAMRPLGGGFAPHDEVDEVRWLPPAAARDLLSYARDVPVLRGFGHDGSRPVLLIRHATAGRREEWQGDDRLRPLDARGVRQAELLVEQLAGHGIERIATSPSARCVQTVEPLGAARGLPVEALDALAEGNGAETLGRLPFDLGAAALCVHGDLAEDLLGEEVAKGSTTLLDRTADGLEAVATLPPPY